MPYFFIFPIYALLFVGLLLVSLVLLFIARLRFLSSYVALGAIGTIPGFLLANCVFWLLFVALGALLQMPALQTSSTVVKDLQAVGIAVFLLVGLSLANVIGCAAGFLGGVWLRFRFRGGQPA